MLFNFTVLAVTTQHLTQSWLWPHCTSHSPDCDHTAPHFLPSWLTSPYRAAG